MGYRQSPSSQQGSIRENGHTKYNAHSNFSVSARKYTSVVSGHAMYKGNTGIGGIK